MASFNQPHSIHIHNAPIMHRVYHPPQQPAPYIRNPYQMNYHPGYYPYPPGFDPNVSLAHPYIYDPTQVKHRRRTTPEQLKILEDTFKTEPKPNAALRKQLSLELGMSPRVLQVWFQNRRMKSKRLAKKRAAVTQRLSAEPEGEHALDASTSPPADKSQHSPAAMTPSTTDNHESPNSPAASTNSSAGNLSSESPPNFDSDRLAPPQDIASLRRGSLPELSISTSELSPSESSPSSAVYPRVRPSSSALEAVTDPALFRRRSMTSLHRLESHPFAPLVAASNGLPQPHQGPIVTPSLPPPCRPRPPASGLHYHSPSTPAAHLAHMPSGMPQTTRSASFHVMPAEHHLHAFNAPHGSQHQHQPYAFPPRPLPAPGPGPLPAPDFSFGTSTPPSTEEMQEEFDVRPYIPSGVSGIYSPQAAAAAAAGVSVSIPRLMQRDDDTDTSYTGYSSRFGSIASIAESDTSASASVSGHSLGGSASGSSVSLGVWDDDARRGSWTGKVADMFSELDVREHKDDSGRESMWADSPGRTYVYTSSSSQESLGDELLYPDAEESTSTPPAAQQELAFGRRQDASFANRQQTFGGRLPISQSSELAYALCGGEWGASGREDSHEWNQDGDWASSKQESMQQGGDEMLELHHALAGYAEHPSVAEVTSSYSIGTFASPGQEGGAPYNLY